MNKETWKNYINPQEMIDKTTNDPKDLLYYIELEKNEDGPRVVLKSIPIKPELSEEQMLHQLNEMIDDFTKEVEDDEMTIERAKLDVAYRSGRGPANKNYKNIWYYCGNVNYDSPILIGCRDGKYAIAKHPNFQNYGFRIKE